MTREQFKARLKGFEGHLNHLYQDSKGHVTVGTGIMLPHAGSIKRKGIVFHHIKARRPATTKEVTEEFKRVKNAPKGMRASSYKQYCQLVATEASLNNALEASLKEAERGAKKYLPNLDQLPITVRFAIIDMVFNMGAAKIWQFKKLKKAIEAKDWAKASTESNRKGIQNSRNEAIRNWIIHPLKAIQKEQSK